MVIAYHLILSCYGFWLPNDPRGSWSSDVRVPALRHFGPATKVTTHRSVAHIAHDRQQRVAAKQALAHPPVKLSGQQARAVAHGLAVAQQRHDLQMYAAAVMPDHVHTVIARHPSLDSAAISRRLKAAATQSVNAEGVGLGRSLWAKGQWVVFLHTPEDVRRTMAYVDDNPRRAGLRPQRWRFVIPYPA